MIDRRLVPDKNVGQGSGNKIGNQTKDPTPDSISLK